MERGPTICLICDVKITNLNIFNFTYCREFRSYDDLELDLDAGVIRFTPSVKLVFKEELSIGSPWDFNVTMPNIPMLVGSLFYLFIM